jgi:hypothetical protein
MASLLTKPCALNAGEGQNLGSHTATLFLEASSEQTGGAFNLFAATRLPGYATSLHIHYAEDVGLVFVPIAYGSGEIYVAMQQEAAVGYKGLTWFGAIVTYGFCWFLGDRQLASSALKPKSESEHKP